MSQNSIETYWESCRSTIVVKRESKFGGRGFVKWIQDFEAVRLKTGV